MFNHDTTHPTHPQNNRQVVANEFLVMAITAIFGHPREISEACPSLLLLLHHIFLY